MNYQKLIDSNKEVSKYTGAYYKIIIHFKKIKCDKAVLLLANELKRRYGEIRAQNIFSLIEYHTNCGHCKEEDYTAIANRIIASGQAILEMGRETVVVENVVAIQSEVNIIVVASNNLPETEEV